jgi:hypothetical protein
MSKRRRTNRKLPKIPRNMLTVRFEFWELETEAFEHLSADATRVYLFMRKRYNGSNNGAIIFSWRDAMQVLRSGSDRAGKALRELQQKGFVKLRTPGEPGPNIRLAGEWQLTVFECGGQPASRTFTRWTRDSERQTPTPETGTPRTQNRYASPAASRAPTLEMAKSVPETGAPADPERTQNRYTCRYTTQGGPEQSEPESRAAPLWAPCRPIRGPRSAAQFGPWLVETANKLGVPPEHIAGELRVDVTDIRRMTRTDERGRGLYDWPPSQRRKVEYALAAWVDNVEENL